MSAQENYPMSQINSINKIVSLNSEGKFFALGSRIKLLCQNLFWNLRNDFLRNMITSLEREIQDQSFERQLINHRMQREKKMIRSSNLMWRLRCDAFELLSTDP